MKQKNVRQPGEKALKGLFYTHLRHINQDFPKCKHMILLAHCVGKKM